MVSWDRLFWLSFVCILGSDDDTLSGKDAADDAAAGCANRPVKLCRTPLPTADFATALYEESKAVEGVSVGSVGAPGVAASEFAIPVELLRCKIPARTGLAAVVSPDTFR